MSGDQGGGRSTRASLFQILALGARDRRRLFPGD